MTRETFGSGFLERQRFVLQQHDRANAARAVLADAKAQLNAAHIAGRVTRYTEQFHADAAAAATAAEIGEEAAIQEFADFVYDYIDQRGRDDEVTNPACPAHSPGVRDLGNSAEPIAQEPAAVNEETAMNRVGEREPSTGMSEG